MALVKCKECKKEIAKSAKSCPHCGAATPRRTSPITWLVLGVIILLVWTSAKDDYQNYTDIAKGATTATDRPLTSTPPPPAKKWTYFETTNPKDDSVTSVLSLEPDTGTSKWGKKFTFVARCKSNTTEMYVNWHDYVGDDSHDVYEDWKWVTVRVGSEDAKKEKWSISTDKTATFSRSAIATLRRIARADKLLFETVPYNENPSVAIYDTKGLDEGIQKIATACHWKL